MTLKVRGTIDVSFSNAPANSGENPAARSWLNSADGISITPAMTFNPGYQPLPVPGFRVARQPADRG